MFNINYKHLRKILNVQMKTSIWSKSTYFRNFAIAFRYFKKLDEDDQTVSNILTQEMGEFKNLFDNLNYQDACNIIHIITKYDNKLARLLPECSSSVHLSHLKKLSNFLKHLITYFDSNKDEIYTLGYCEDCGDTIQSDELTAVHNADSYVCEDCLHNYEYVDSAGTYLHAESDEYAEYMEYGDGEDCDNSDFEGVYRWDYPTEERLCKQKLKQEPQITKTTLVSGLEIEMEAREDCPYDFPQQITDLFNEEYCMFKGDGSLNRGFEMVTAPCTLEYHREALSKLFNWHNWKDDDGNTHVKAWNTDTCGLHINLNRKSFSQAEIGKILVFINDEMNTKFINKVSGRSSEGYAKRSPKKISDGKFINFVDEKYVAVNLTHTTHIELRIFRGNVTRNGILRCLEFSYALAHYVKRCSIKISSLHYQEFLKWFNNPRIKSQYPYFNEWLVRKNYIKGGTTNRIVTNELNQAIDNVVNG